MRTPWLILFTLAAVYQVAGSRGDQSEEFQECTFECVNTCGTADAPMISLWNRIMLWSCHDECKYKCMWTHQESSKTPMQYYGKWPFKRLFGCQEFFSVIFSLGNLYAQWRGYRQFSRINSLVNSQSYPWSFLVWLMYTLNCNGWIWSSVFHARDTILTERLDYFSAVALVMMSFLYSIIRVLEIIDYEKMALIATPFIVYYAFHIGYLHFIKFDYKYNMIITVGMGMCFNAVCIYLGATRGKHYRKAMIVGFAFILAGLLEVFDFPPMFGLIDAHALWHLATIPITKVWYDFLIEDSVSYAHGKKQKLDEKY